MSLTMSIRPTSKGSSSTSESSPVIASWDKGLNFGPLTTTFTPEASCSVPVVVTDPQGPTFIPPMAYQVFVSCDSGDAKYNTACWPPPVSTNSNFQPWNYGFYSPAYICPHGYATACSQTPGALSNIPDDPGDFSFQYKPTSGEYAVGCCPT